MLTITTALQLSILPLEIVSVSTRFAPLLLHFREQEHSASSTTGKTAVSQGKEELKLLLQSLTALLGGLPSLRSYSHYVDRKLP